MLVLRFFLACPTTIDPGMCSGTPDAFLCLPHGDTLPHPAARTSRLAPATRSTITAPPFQFASALPVVDWATDCPPNPIADRVRRKRQRPS